MSTKRPHSSSSDQGKGRDPPSFRIKIDSEDTMRPLNPLLATTGGPPLPQDLNFAVYRPNSKRDPSLFLGAETQKSTFTAQTTAASAKEDNGFYCEYV